MHNTQSLNQQFIMFNFSSENLNNNIMLLKKKPIMPIDNNRVIILILKGAHLYIWIANAVQVGEMKTCSSIVHVYQEKLLNLTFPY